MSLNILSTNSKIKKETNSLFLNASTAIGVICVLIFIYYGMNKGIFASSEVFSEYIKSLGVFAPLSFILIQIIQVVIPILPGGISCVAGVLSFGIKMGFIYNYIGLCIGSIIAFLLARTYGMNLVKKLVKKKYLDKYLSWLDKGKNFKIFLAVCFFIPVAPDDLLCLVAGLSKMKLKTFIVILLVFKPFSIFVYSLGLKFVLSLIGIG